MTCQQDRCELSFLIPPRRARPLSPELWEGRRRADSLSWGWAVGSRGRAGRNGRGPAEPRTAGMRGECGSG